MLVAASSVTSITDPVLGQMALALLLLIAAAHVLGHLASRLHQPRMIGEIVAGVVLGPSILGHFAPGFSARIFGAGGADPRGVVLGPGPTSPSTALWRSAGSARHEAEAVEDELEVVLSQGVVDPVGADLVGEREHPLVR